MNNALSAERVIRNCFLAVDAGGTYLKSALFLEGGILQEHSFLSIPVDSMGDAPGIKASYQELVKTQRDLASEAGVTIGGIGVCIPGPFDYAGGVCRMKHKYAAIYGIPMRPWFEEVISNAAVTFVHDSEAFLRGAIRLGKISYSRVCGVIIGTGLGFAVARNQVVLRNQAGGPKISIFQMRYRDGTAEDYVSKRGMLKRYQELSGDGRNREVLDIANAARSGETAAIRTFQDTGVHLAAILHDIIRENELECLLLGGAISKSSELFLPQLKEGLQDIPSLKLIKEAEDIDNVPLYGIFS